MTYLPKSRNCVNMRPNCHTKKCNYFCIFIFFRPVRGTVVLRILSIVPHVMRIVPFGGIFAAVPLFFSQTSDVASFFFYSRLVPRAPPSGPVRPLGSSPSASSLPKTAYSCLSRYKIPPRYTISANKFAYVRKKQ